MAEVGLVERCAAVLAELILRVGAMRSTLTAFRLAHGQKIMKPDRILNHRVVESVPAVFSYPEAGEAQFGRGSRGFGRDRVEVLVRDEAWCAVSNAVDDRETVEHEGVSTDHGSFAAVLTLKVQEVLGIVIHGADRSDRIEAC